jgi:rabenosyn-5
MLLPRFQRLLNLLQDPDTPPTSVQLSEASKTRKRLMDSFTQYDIAARRIRDLPTTSPTQQKLQRAVYQQASNFLHLHMLPLKTLPKILRHATPHGKARVNDPPSALPNGKPHYGSALASIKYNSLEPDGSSQMSSASSQISALEAEEKSLRERLIVLEEQKFFVGEMIADAKKRRKLDEVAALTGNVEDLGREIDSVQGLLAGLDFEGAYTGTGPMNVLASPTMKGKG